MKKKIKQNASLYVKEETFYLVKQAAAKEKKLVVDFVSDCFAPYLK